MLNFFFEKQFFLISRFMLFSTLKKNNNITYWLNGRWFLQIVDGESWNLYPLYPLFPCSDFVSQMWGGLGGGCNVFLTFYAISNISRNKIWEYKPIISHLMFSSCFFLYVANIEKFYHEIGNIEKVPLHLLVKWGGGFSKS